MSLHQKRINQHLDNQYLRQSAIMPNKIIRLVKLTHSDTDDNEEPHFNKEPLDYNPRNYKQSKSRKTSDSTNLKFSSLESSKFYIFNKSKPLKTLVQVDLKNFKISDQKKITEKFQNNLKKISNASIPTDEMPIKTIKSIENKILSKTKTAFKLDNSILKFPMDNFVNSKSNQKMNVNDNDNKFSVILQSQVKRSKESGKNKMKEDFDEDWQDNSKTKTSRNKYKKINNLKKVGNIQKREDEKLIKENKEKNIKNIQIIHNENKISKVNDNTSKKLEKKEKVNEENIPKNKEQIKSKKPNIEINIIKNDVTKKVILKSETKDKNNSKTNIQKIKSQMKKPIIDNHIETENNKDNKSKSKPIIINIKSNKKSEIDKKKKVYDITIDKIKEDINTEKKHQREKRKKVRSKSKDYEMDIKINNPKEKREKIGSNSEDYEMEIELKNPKDNYSNSNKMKNNKDKKKVENNITEIEPKELWPKDKENNKMINSIIQNITINNTIILNGKSIKKSVEPNKINKNNIKIIKQTKDKNETKEKKEDIEKYEINENKEKIEIKQIKVKKPIKGHKIKKNKKIEEEINYKFIQQIIQRYKDSPVNIIRNNSDTFSKSKKKSSVFIFNKIISSIEKKNELIYPNNIQPIFQNTNTGYHFQPNDFEYIGILGEGEYGKIYLVQWVKNDNQLYAMKIEKYKYYEEINNIQNITHIIKDFEEKTNSYGIIKIYGDICLNSDNIYYYYTLMERCERDAEQECILRNKYQEYFTEQNLIDILCQLIITCSALQKHSICHRDIKPQNILILNGIYKLTDFGEVIITEPKGMIEQEIAGTELYMSPKLFFAMKKKQKTVRHNPYKSDVFSLALCMLLLATFNYDSLVKIRELVDMSLIERIVTEFLSIRYSQNLIAFLMPMLEVDENKRPDFIDLENQLIKNNAQIF